MTDGPAVTKEWIKQQDGALFAGACAEFVTPVLPGDLPESPKDAE